jgi:hypothetical protein
MRKLILTGGALIGCVIAAAACHPVRHPHYNAGAVFSEDHGMWSNHDDQPVTVATRLSCPDHEGDLTRITEASDGKSCAYKGDNDGRDVSLTLVGLDGKSPQDALLPTEADLRALVPAHPAGRDMVNIDASDDGDHDHDHAKVDLPGIHINADGQKAQVKVFGFNIDADGDKADIQTPKMGVKGATIHAGPSGAEIRAGDVGKNAADLVFILAGDNAGPSGYRAVGYVARGPAAGPLVVGEFKSREGGHDHHDRDLERLIDLNVTPAGETGHAGE